ncbi:alpha/beta hydrolase [Streptomyces diastatochromogenes]|nr:alpha/beta hydrolase [Streptomyces diastatochromogenes]
MSRITSVAAGPYAPPAPTRTLTAVSADGARLHVEVHGPENAPPVVLSHGWTCSTAFWAAQIRELAADHRVIAYDQRGHGRSPASHACTTEALADDLEAVLAQTLARGEKALVVGHSMGGMTVMAASRAPASANTPPPSCCAARAARGWSRSRAWCRCAPGVCAPGSPGASSVRAPSRPGHARREAHPQVRDHGRRFRPAHGGGVRADRARLPARRAPHLGRRARGARPRPRRTGVARAHRGGARRVRPAHAPVHARALAAALPQCIGLTELPGVGHMTPIEAPESVTGRIRELVTTYVTENTPVQQIKEGA